MPDKKEECSVATMEELQEYVYEELCRDNELLAGEFPTTSTPLKRAGGEICGMIFCVHGPRRVDFSAIWEKNTNRVLFYRPSGERYRYIKLAQVPALE